jgi:hypothetical protein
MAFLAKMACITLFAIQIAVPQVCHAINRITKWKNTFKDGRRTKAAVTANGPKPHQILIVR